MTLAQGNYPFLDLIWTMLVFFGWVIWFWLLIVIFGDLFRRDISGWAKAGWTIVVIALPFIGVLVYLGTQGRHMQERRQAEASATQKQFDDYVRSVSADGGGPSDQIAKAKKLLDDGAISEEEYRALKEKALASR